MFWTFIATVFCGLGAAGIALGIRAISRNKAPRWLIPVFAGAGMLGYLIYGEYTWFELKQSQLPEEAIIVDTESDGVVWRPWTFIAPYVTAFSTVDTKSIRKAGDDGQVAQFTLYRFEQKITDTVSHRAHLLHCGNRELVPLEPDGKPRLDNMKRLGPDDRLYQTVCQ